MTEQDLADGLRASLLDTWNGSTDEGGMGVPEGYFEGVGARVMERIAAEERGVDAGEVDTGVREVVSLRRRVMWAVASAAAALVLMLGAGVYFYNAQGALDAKIEGLVASDAEVDELIDHIDGQYVEDILAYYE